MVHQRTKIWSFLVWCSYRGQWAQLFCLNLSGMIDSVSFSRTVVKEKNLCKILKMQWQGHFESTDIQEMILYFQVQNLLSPENHLSPKLVLLQALASPLCRWQRRFHLDEGRTIVDLKFPKLCQFWNPRLQRFWNRPAIPCFGLSKTNSPKMPETSGNKCMLSRKALGQVLWLPARSVHLASF